MTNQSYNTQLSNILSKPDAPEPQVFARDGQVFANSRSVAAYFEKRHDDVLKAIRTIIKAEPELGVRNFAETPYVEIQNGQTYKCFEMDREGFELLGMGFTGAKALKWKISYVKAFKLMEDQLRKPQAIDFSDPRIILGAFQHLQITCNDQAIVIAEQGTRLKKLDRLEGADGTMCLTDAAKTLNMRPIDLIKLMQSRRWIYKRAGNKSWVAFQNRLTEGVLFHDDHIYKDADGHERVATRALVTAKGLVRLAALIEEKTH